MQLQNPEISACRECRALVSFSRLQQVLGHSRGSLPFRSCRGGRPPSQTVCSIGKPARLLSSRCSQLRNGPGLSLPFWPPGDGRWHRNTHMHVRCEEGGSGTHSRVLEEPRPSNRLGLVSQLLSKAVLTWNSSRPSGSWKKHPHHLFVNNLLCQLTQSLRSYWQQKTVK